MRKAKNRTLEQKKNMEPNIEHDLASILVISPSIDSETQENTSHLSTKSFSLKEENIFLKSQFETLKIKVETCEKNALLAHIPLYL